MEKQSLKTLKEIIPEIKCDAIMDPGLYNLYSIIPFEDADRKLALEKLNGIKLETVESKAIASMLGMAIGDALGANIEFLKFDRKRVFITKGFDDLKPLLASKKLNKREEIGIWTDDASMGLCLADSILAQNFVFNALDLRYRFQLWLHYGYNNGGRPYSIGLGGNIKISMDEFIKFQKSEVEMGDRMNNGNGSLMRLAPVPVAYHNDLKTAVKVAQDQSRTTHNGEEAEECCKLMTTIMIRLFYYQGLNPKEVLDNVGLDFETTCESVKCLAKSQQETLDSFKAQQAKESFKSFNKKIEDRDWNWKSALWNYSPTRLKLNSGYIGSYCMDALAMALHICYHTASFQEAIFMAVNMGGDCDTVGSIAGQIAGAMYGVDAKMVTLYSEMLDCKMNNFEVLVKAYKLFHKKAVV
jgi:ADP-ribosylglycohydrolase